MKYFYVENNNDISSNDLQNLRMFYSPIIGANAISLYQYLLDLQNIYNANTKYDFKETSEFLLLNDDLIIESKDKLEAVGLLKTYKNEENGYLFELIKPLNANEIVNNPFINNLIKDKIGEEAYKKIINAKASFSFKKDNFEDVSKKYFDVFQLNDDIYKKEESDFDFFVSDLESYAKTVDSEKFIENFTKSQTSPTQNLMLKNLRNLKFSDECINLFINYSIKVNNLIVCSYIEKIAKDYASKNIFLASDITSELNNAYLLKSNQNVTKSTYFNKSIEVENSLNYMRNITEDLDWDD